MNGGAARYCRMNYRMNIIIFIPDRQMKWSPPTQSVCVFFSRQSFLELDIMGSSTLSSLRVPVYLTINRTNKKIHLIWNAHTLHFQITIRLMGQDKISYTFQIPDNVVGSYRVNQVEFEMLRCGFQ